MNGHLKAALYLTLSAGVVFGGIKTVQYVDAASGIAGLDAELAAAKQSVPVLPEGHPDITGGDPTDPQAAPYVSGQKVTAEIDIDAICAEPMIVDRDMNDLGFSLGEAGFSDETPTMLYEDPNTTEWKLFIKQPADGDRPALLCKVAQGSQWIHRTLVPRKGT